MSGALPPIPRGLSLWFPGGHTLLRNPLRKKRTALQPSSRQPGRALRSLLSVALSSLPVKRFYYNMAKDSFASVPDKLSAFGGTVHVYKGEWKNDMERRFRNH